MNGHDFDRFVAEGTDGLLRTAYLIVGDLHEAEDLVQETLFKVARRWPKVSRMDYPAAYARRILVNLALRGGLKRSRRRTELSETLPGDPSAPAAPLDRHDELHDALAALPPRQRAVLVLRYFLDLPEAEVAAALQCSLGTVKSTASRNGWGVAWWPGSQQLTSAQLTTPSGTQTQTFPLSPCGLHNCAGGPHGGAPGGGPGGG